jgi:hypothetical protein
MDSSLTITVYKTKYNGARVYGEEIGLRPTYVRFQVTTAAIMKFKVFWDVGPCSHVEVHDVSEVRTASIIRAVMTKAVRTSETSAQFNMSTRRYFPDDSKLQYLLKY